MFPKPEPVSAIRELGNSVFCPGCAGDTKMEGLGTTWLEKAAASDKTTCICSLIVGKCGTTFQINDLLLWSIIRRKPKCHKKIHSPLRELRSWFFPSGALPADDGSCPHTSLQQLYDFTDCTYKSKT